MEDYEQDPGTKLDATIQILKHHLAAPTQPVLRNLEDIEEVDDDEVYSSWSNTFVASETVPACDPSVKDEADKGIIFSSFPSHNIYLLPVSHHLLLVSWTYIGNADCLYLKLLKWHNVTAFCVRGSMPTKARAKVVEEYRRFKGPAVLVLSPMGMTGLNLDCANFMIIMVSLFD